MAKLKSYPKLPKAPTGNPTPKQVEAYKTKVSDYEKRCAEIKKHNDAIDKAKEDVLKLKDKAKKARK